MDIENLGIQSSEVLDTYFQEGEQTQADWNAWHVVIGRAIGRFKSSVLIPQKVEAKNRDPRIFTLVKSDGIIPKPVITLCRNNEKSPVLGAIKDYFDPKQRKAQQS